MDRIQSSFQRLREIFIKALIIGVAMTPRAVFGAQEADKSDLLQYQLQPLESRVVYSGYSKKLLPIKTDIREGKLDAAIKKYDQLQKSPLADEAAGTEAAPDANKTPEQLAEEARLKRIERLDKTDFLFNVEFATLSLDSGNPDVTVEHIGWAEQKVIEDNSSDSVSKGARSLFSVVLETVSGDEELAAYTGAGFERILMLNYKALAYVLLGDRKAYNITRRAIDWQNIERKRFEAEIQAAKAETQKKEQELGSNPFKQPTDGWQAALNQATAAGKKKAKSVSSAFVNPFGFYIAGMVQELEAFKDPSLRDNARISYEKALDLNPESSILKRAVEDTRAKKWPADQRLVHVVVADGFAPEKKTFLYGVPFQDQVVPVKLPVYLPVESKVAKIQVRAMDGSVLHTLSTLADVEAITLRYQEDRQVVDILRVLTALIRTFAEKSLLSNTGFLGNLLGSVRDSMTTPDMRAWATLPSRFLAGRLYLPEGVKQVQLVSLDSGGRVLAKQTVKLGKGHSIIYGRAVDKFMTAHTNRKLWTDL